MTISSVQYWLIDMIKYIRYLVCILSHKVFNMENKIEPNMKTPISVTLDKDLVKWIDEQVLKGRYRNRSHFVEVCLQDLRQYQRKSEA